MPSQIRWMSQQDTCQKRCSEGLRVQQGSNQMGRTERGFLAWEVHWYQTEGAHRRTTD